MLGVRRMYKGPGTRRPTSLPLAVIGNAITWVQRFLLAFIQSSSPVAKKREKTLKDGRKTQIGFELYRSLSSSKF